MKPDWDKLMAEFKDSSTILVADVDCTTAAKPLCTTHGVRGFPTIKYGDPSDPAAMQKYEKGRDFASLSAFAKGLKPQCTPAFLENCPAEDKAFLEKVMAMSAADLKAEVEKSKQGKADAEKALEDATAALEAAKKNEKLVGLVSKSSKKEEL
jgi:hypothetical protein